MSLKNASIFAMLTPFGLDHNAQNSIPKLSQPWQLGQ
jgi:hypothetical protein